MSGQINSLRHFLRTHKILPRYRFNLTQSPLLRLPGEIRNQIFEEVFSSGKPLHVDVWAYRPAPPPYRARKRRRQRHLEIRYKWLAAFCAVEDHDRLDTYSVDSDTPGSLRPGQAYPIPIEGCLHAQCDLFTTTQVQCWRDEYERDFPKRLRKHSAQTLANSRKIQLLDLRVLRTCRQINSEATRIFWTSTVFSFSGRASFEGFLKQRTPAQKLMIKRLDLRVVSGPLHNSLMLSLRWVSVALIGLKELRLDLDLPIDETVSNSLEAGYKQALILIKNLRQAAPSLSRAYVQVANSTFSNPHKRLSKSESLVLASQCQLRLLPPGGTINYDAISKDEMRILGGQQW